MKIYGVDGALAKKLPKYKDRIQQQQLSKLVNQCMKSNTDLVVEAPTGSGKSVGALVPFLTRLEKDKKIGRRYIICTATHALQEQYIKKEIPLFKSIGFDFSFALMKGISNYYCPYKLFSLIKKRRNQATMFLAGWVKKTETGDLSEVTSDQRLLLAGMDIRGHLDECLRAKCPYYLDCPYFRMRGEAQEANVIVVNYHTFLSHLGILATSGNFFLLPKVTNILFDEAHVLRDLARDFFGYAFFERSLNPVISYIEKHYPDTATRFRTSVNAFFTMLAAYLGGKNMRLAYDMNPKYYSKVYGTLLKNLAMAQSKIDDEIRNFMAAVGDINNAKYLLHARRLSKQCSNTRAFLSKLEDFLVNKGSAARSGQAVWVTRQPKGVELSMMPINIAGIFSSQLVDACVQATFMSATLEPKEFIKQVGLDQTGRKVVGKKLSHVFDYQKQAALFVPNIGEPDGKAVFDNTVGDLLCDVCRMLEGGVLALFTSYRALNVAAEKVKKISLEYEVLTQEPGVPAAQLADEFRKGNRVLLATRSFFQGVDFPGDVVKAVLINQIPFRHFDDPVIQTLKYFGSNSWFQNEQLPHAKILFKQAFGRLIRRETDTGIIICTDVRLLTKNYGAIILKVLPDLPLLQEWDEFTEKLEELC